MRTRFIVSLLMVIALAFSIVSTASADTGATGSGNTFDPSKMTQADKDALAAKIKLVDSFMKTLAGKVSPDSVVTYQLAVGAGYQEPNNSDYNDYCGPAASQVALSARTSSVPTLKAVAKAEYTVPYPPGPCSTGCGTNIGWVKNVLNTDLNTSYYVNGAASSQTQFSSWLIWDIESGWSLITLLSTKGMPGWTVIADHYVATYQIIVNGATLNTLGYVDTASITAGHSGSYFNSSINPGTFWDWITNKKGYGQVW